jgi:hypothetical protein
MCIPASKLMAAATAILAVLEILLMQGPVQTTIALVAYRSVL